MKKLLSACLIGVALCPTLSACTTDVSAKSFTVYDRMDYVGKPDLTNKKLSKVFLIYESDLVKPDPQGKRSHGVLNIPRIQALAAQAKQQGYNEISTDIETWFLKKDGQDLGSATIDHDFRQMYGIFKQANPKARVGNYGVSVFNLNTIRYFRPGQPESAILTKWRQVNVRSESAAAAGDELHPNFYIATPDIAQWRNDVKVMTAEMKKKNPNKRIIAYIWPQYYSAKGSPFYKKFISPTVWRQMLEICYQYVDGVIIWSDKRDEFGQIVRWGDPRLMPLMQTTYQFINSHGNNIHVDALHAQQ